MIASMGWIMGKSFCLSIYFQIKLHREFLCLLNRKTKKSKMKDKNHSRDHDGASMKSGMRSHSNMSVVTMSSSTNSLDNRKSAHKNKSRINKNVKVSRGGCDAIRVRGATLSSYALHHVFSFSVF